jgi:hypothetical protein
MELLTTTTMMMMTSTTAEPFTTESAGSHIHTYM